MCLKHFQEDPLDDPNEGVSAVALYDYQAAADDEISFDPDDIITNIEMVSNLILTVCISYNSPSMYWDHVLRGYSSHGAFIYARPTTTYRRITNFGSPIWQAGAVGLACHTAMGQILLALAEFCYSTVSFFEQSFVYDSFELAREGTCLIRI